MTNYIKVLKPSKAQREQRWYEIKVWSFPDTELQQNSDESRRYSRKKLSPELELKRQNHMKSLFDEGATYAMIGRLYGLSRDRVRTIIKKAV